MIILPAGNIRVLGFTINSFRFWSLTGFALAVSLVLMLTKLVNLNSAIILLLTGGAVLSFLMLAFLQKQITGRETLVYYHHEIAIVCVAAFMLKALDQPVLPYLDLTMVALGIILAFGRIGCFSVGCCHGLPHKNGAVYNKDHVTAGFTWYYRDIPLFPIQLLESIFVATTTLAGIFLILRNTAPGTVLILYTVGYGLFRFIAECFRGDPGRRYWLGISEAQWISWCLIGVGLILAHTSVLPAFLWHQLAFGLTTILSVGLIWRSNQLGRLSLLPDQIRQIAEGLTLLAQYQAKITTVPSTRTIPVFETTQGLSISAEQHQLDHQILYQYTISAKPDISLNPSAVHGLARLIKTLKRHTSHFRILQREGRIYHILFQENAAIDM